MNSGGRIRTHQQKHYSNAGVKENRSLLPAGTSDPDRFAKPSELLRARGFTGSQLVLISDAMHEAGLEFREMAR